MRLKPMRTPQILGQTIAGPMIGLGMLSMLSVAACDKSEPAPPTSTPAPADAARAESPPAAAWSVKLQRSAGAMLVEGQGPTGFVASLRTALAAHDGCLPPQQVIAVAEIPTLAVEHAFPHMEQLTELMCVTQSHDLTIDSGNRQVSGTATHWDSLVRRRRSVSFGDTQIGTWRFAVSLQDEPTFIPEGFGRLRVVPWQGADTAKLVLTPIHRGEALEEPVGVGWLGVVKPGIYAVSNGDHVAIREGFETRYLPGNPAALVFAGKRFPLDDTLDVRLFSDPQGLSFESADVIAECKAMARKPCVEARKVDKMAIAHDDMPALLRQISQVMFHADGTHESAMTYRVLKARGMSTHIAIDFDGTLFQFTDLGRLAKHAPESDNQSIGIDLNNLLPDLLKEADALPYSPTVARANEMAKHPRPKSDVATIGYIKVRSWGYTEAQWRSTLSVARLLVRIFPRIAATYPSHEPGEPSPYPLAEPMSFRGFLAHYHADTQRWDPGPGFDWQRLGTALTPFAAPVEASAP